MYKGSPLWPVAPEYTTGEVLLAGTYRKFVLRETEASIDLEEISNLPGRLSYPDLWQALTTQRGGLASPSLRGQRKGVPLPQLMPLVPQIAHFAGVLGRRRNRWDPGNLLISTLASGAGPDDARKLIVQIRTGLKVNVGDDIFARFVESSLQVITQPVEDPEPAMRSAVWRTNRSGELSPAERFSRDLPHIIRLKDRLTRRQWTTLVEACLRLGLGMHVLWLARLNGTLWKLAIGAYADGKVPRLGALEDVFWRGLDDPGLIELGRDAVPMMRRIIQEFAEARIGINLLLHLLEETGAPWKEQLATTRGSTSPVESLSSFLQHVVINASFVKKGLHDTFGTPSLREAAGNLADSNPSLMAARSGSTKNLYEYLRYCLGQLQPADDDFASYDQAYILHKKYRQQPNSPWLVHPGPAALILLGYACCQSSSGAPATLDDFRAFFADYGIKATTAELQSGRVGVDLERLGLVVDSPDAGGGRLLVSPF
jgi:hypothetical protein